MKTRLTALALVVLLALSVLSVSAAATEETLFERYIPINQAYSASVNPFSGSEIIIFLFSSLKRVPIVKVYGAPSVTLKGLTDAE